MAGHLILFVHGLGGTPKGTWGNFESLLSADRDLGGVDVAHFSFPTFPFRFFFGPKYPGVLTLAQALATQIENRHGTHDDITLVCHSLGGLIGKQYLIDCLTGSKTLRITRAVFYAVPNNGAKLADLASLISWRHPQLRHLCRDSDVVRTIAQAWTRTKAESVIAVRYVVAAQDEVVDEQSARATWGNDLVDVLGDRGHVDVVKPQTSDDLAFLILKNHIIRTRVVSARGLAPAPVDMHAPRREPSTTRLKPDAACQAGEARIATSAVLRIELNMRYLLVQNIHRPESFAPFGGVYKFHGPARDKLDSFSFRQQAVDEDMRNDIRGYIARDSLDSFRAWFEAGADRESAYECLRRELHEELREVGLEDGLVPARLEFRQVRRVEEPIEHLASLGCEQFRIFDIYEIVPDLPDARRLLDALANHAESCSRLLWVDADAARRGRASSGEVIAAHVPYLFGTRRFRDPDPLFAVG